MIILEWNGEIGWELSAYRVKNDLKDANGDDITVRFSSPGGSIAEGGDIYLALINYRKNNPKAKMLLEVQSVVASYASLISASPVWDNVAVSDISMAMYHNPANFVYGDFNVMEENASMLRDARDMYENIYSLKSGATSDETKEMMNKTTWLMGGQAIVDAGFADEVISLDSGDSDMKMLSQQAKMSYETVMAKMSAKAQKEKNEPEYMKAVACMKEINTIITPEPKGDSDNNKPSSEGQSKMEVPKMTPEELEKFKKDNPEAYQAMMKEGMDQEKASNSERVRLLTEMKKDEDYKDLPEVQEVLDNAIMGTDTVDSVLPKINIAVMKIMKDPARMSALESPTDIDGGGDSKVEMKIKKTAVM